MQDIKPSMVNLIAQAIIECELIDTLQAHALPLYINYQWASEGVAQRYRDKLNNAQELIELIDRLKDEKPGDILLNDITFD
jgi:hypothetical protein